MAPKSKRTITEVLDYETGESIDSDIFFNRPLDEIIIYRARLQKAIENFTEPLLGCYYCKQKIRIRGGVSRLGIRKTEMFHFAHLKDSGECHIKTKNQFTKEEVDRIKYNGAKESPLHQHLKDCIAECLRKNEVTKKEFSSVEVEKVIRDKVAKEWKKPDINAIFYKRRIAIELQLSTTWLDVITRRQHFYKQQGIYIFWVFHTFNVNDDLRKLTFNDVIYTNNQNAYIFDKEALELSKSENDLILKCFYKTYYREEVKLCEKWETSIIKFSDLTFDEFETRIYYHDAESQKKKVEKEIKDYIFKLQEASRLKIIEEQKQKRICQEEFNRKEELEIKNKEIINAISVVVETKNEIAKIRDRSKSKLSELIEFDSRKDIHVDKILRYFANQQRFNKPFYNQDDLFNSLKEEFEKEVKTTSQTLKEKIAEEEIINGKLEAIGKLEFTYISNKKYSIINNSNHWDYIKDNYSKILVIPKKEVNGLFPAEYLKPIKGVYELNQYQNAKDTSFLTDFSDRIKELEEKKAKYSEIIHEKEKFLDNLSQRIKTKFETYLKTEINKIKEDIQGYSDREIKLNKEISKMETDLKNPSLV